MPNNRQCICIKDILSHMSSVPYYSGRKYYYDEISDGVIHDFMVYPLDAGNGVGDVIRLDKFECYFTPINVYRNNIIDTVLDEKS
jgi:hypothetical protein